MLVELPWYTDVLSPLVMAAEASRGRSEIFGQILTADGPKLSAAAQKWPETYESGRVAAHEVFGLTNFVGVGLGSELKKLGAIRGTTWSILLCWVPGTDWHWTHELRAVWRLGISKVMGHRWQ